MPYKGFVSNNGFINNHPRGTVFIHNMSNYERKSIFTKNLLEII